MNQTHKIDFSTKGDVSGVSFLLGTSGRGLLFFNKGELHSLIPEGRVYGITYGHNKWWATRKLDKSKDEFLVSFSLSNNELCDYSVEVDIVPRGVHQIDFINNLLYVNQARRNGFSIYKLHNNSLSLQNEIFPNGTLSQKTHRYNQDNYCHFNSVFSFDKKIYLMAHNNTYKTGKNSEIYVLDAQNNLLEKISTTAQNAHNIYVNKNVMLYCDSLNQSLICNYDGKEERVFTCDFFTRGLSVSHDFVIVGGSTLSLDDRSKRSKAGAFYILDRDSFKIIGEVVITGADVKEIRRLDSVELCLSNSHYGTG